VRKLYWTKSEGSKDVCFDNSPFTVDREVLLGATLLEGEEEKGQAQSS